MLDFDAGRVASATRAITALLEQLELNPAAVIPASARRGDNAASRSARTGWYRGPTLTEALSVVPPLASRAERPLRLPVQDVYRFDSKRVVVGRIEGGRVAVGDTLVIGTQGAVAKAATLEGWPGQPGATAEAGQSVALTLTPDVVVERGDLLHAGAHPPLRAAEALLFRRGIDVSVLDGDTLRARLSSDLGFSPEDRRENMRRAAVVARLLADSGQVVLAALISPRADDRAMARQAVGEGFREVYVEADRAVCEMRDPKGLYAAARAGRLSGFTGVDAPYEPPAAPDLVIGTAAATVGSSAERLAAFVAEAVALPGLVPRSGGAD